MVRRSTSSPFSNTAKILDCPLGGLQEFDPHFYFYHICFMKLRLHGFYMFFSRTMSIVFPFWRAIPKGGYVLYCSTKKV